MSRAGSAVGDTPLDGRQNAFNKLQKPLLDLLTRFSNINIINSSIGAVTGTFHWGPVAAIALNTQRQNCQRANPFRTRKRQPATLMRVGGFLVLLV